MKTEEFESYDGLGLAGLVRSGDVSATELFDAAIARVEARNPELNAVDNVMILATIIGMTLRQARASIEEILAFAGLEKFANLELKYFSSGMAARLAYSVAFKAVREVLVVDEIFAVGDAGFKARCEERYRELSAAGYTVILVSHDPETVSMFCNRALLLEGGRVVMNDTAENVAKTYVSISFQAAEDGSLG